MGAEAELTEGRSCKIDARAVGGEIPRHIRCGCDGVDAGAFRHGDEGGVASDGRGGEDTAEPQAG